MKDYANATAEQKLRWLLTERNRTLGRYRKALLKIANEVDHVGKDHAFEYCNQIAREALGELKSQSVARRLEVQTKGKSNG